MKKINKILFSLFLILALTFLVLLYIKTQDKPELKSIIISELVKIPKAPTEEELKLIRLDNINKKIAFFNMKYLDRYLKYKEKNPTMDNEKIVINVNIGLDRPFFQEPQEAKNKHLITVIANKYYFLGENYIPEKLTTVNSKCTMGNHKLTEEAALAFERLCFGAINDGYSVKINSSYRSYYSQRSIYNNYVNNSGVKEADTYSARPGYSEHQTGLAVDVASGGNSFLRFGSTRDFQWMKNNAHKYGFILRYKEEYVPITGYISEPWHYRYVGVDIATYIYENPMTYEEYFVRFLEK